MNRLSPKTCRRLARITGLDVIHGWSNGYSHGAFTHQVATSDGLLWLVSPRTGAHATVHELRALDAEIWTERRARINVGISRLTATLQTREEFDRAVAAREAG